MGKHTSAVKFGCVIMSFSTSVRKINKYVKYKSNTYQGNTYYPY